MTFTNIPITDMDVNLVTPTKIAVFMVYHKWEKLRGEKFYVLS